LLARDQTYTCDCFSSNCLTKSGQKKSTSIEGSIAGCG
jgi:hypothetical protein